MNNTKEIVVETLKSNVRVIDEESYKAIQIYDDYGTKVSIPKSAVTEEVWNAFKSEFPNF